MITYKHKFLRAAEQWICDGYFITIRYIAFNVPGADPWLADAEILVHPLPESRDDSFCIQASNLSIGQINSGAQSRSHILALLNLAVNGELSAHGQCFSLQFSTAPDYFSDMAFDESALNTLHLQVIGAATSSHANVDFVEIDNQLRGSSPPFDGLSDVIQWFGFSTPRSTTVQPSIKIRVAPPVDLVVDQTSLARNQLNILLEAHLNINRSDIGLAVRAAPGNGLLTRKHIEARVVWTDSLHGSLIGKVNVELEAADNVNIMLMLGGETVRRHWSIDPTKTGNSRLAAAQVFDPDLKRLKKVLFEGVDSKDFEKGIGLLAFLLGCSAAVTLETNAPDLILTTPRGRVALVECTLKIADFANKVGKLFDRKNELKKTIGGNGQHMPIHAFLVCASPMDQIHHDPAVLLSQEITLVTREDLHAAFNHLRLLLDPDRVLSAIEKRFDSQRSSISGL